VTDAGLVHLKELKKPELRLGLHGTQVSDEGVLGPPQGTQKPDATRRAEDEGDGEGLRRSRRRCPRAGSNTTAAQSIRRWSPTQTARQRSG